MLEDITFLKFLINKRLNLAFYIPQDAYCVSDCYILDT